MYVTIREIECHKMLSRGKKLVNLARGSTGNLAGNSTKQGKLKIFIIILFFENNNNKVRLG